MGPPPQPIEQPGQNVTAINDFCVVHGLDEAARDSLKKMMSSVLQ